MYYTNMESFHTSMKTLPFPYTFTNNTSSAGSCITSCSNYTTPWMDSRIWSKLPQRLLDRVIAFLSPPAFFRARCVCKRWYALLFSNNFLQLYLEISPCRHWFLFFKQKSRKSYIYKSSSNGTVENGVYTEGYLFDPDETAWYRLSSFSLIPSGFSPTSSSGGLICWVSEEAGPKTLLLCNPIVGSVTQLSPTLKPRLFPSIGLLVRPSSIDVTIAGDDMISPYAVKNLTAESFHIDGSGFYSIWGTASCLPRLCSFESGRMVYAQGKYFCMNYGPFSVLAYDIPTNSWCKIQAPMRRFLLSPSLVECRGRLLLVAAVEKSKLNVPKSLRVWGLQSCGTTWVEIERMPQQLYLQFSDLEAGNGFECVGNGEFIVIMIRGSSSKSLLFNVSNKIWQWIPPCPYNNQDGDRIGMINGACDLHAFAYDPRLATPVIPILDQLTNPFQPYNGSCYSSCKDFNLPLILTMIRDAISSYSWPGIQHHRSTNEEYYFVSSVH